MEFRAAQLRLPLPLLAAAGFLSSAGARVADSLLDALARDFHVGVPEVAIILPAFTIPYGLLQLLVGPLADRVGKPRVLVMALLAYCAATAGCAMATGLLPLTLLRVCAGAASAGLIPVCLAYIGDGTSYANRQVALSRFLMGVVFAQVLAGPIGGLLGQFASWRDVFLLLALAAFILAVLIVVRLRGFPRQQRGFPGDYSYGALLQPGPCLLLLLTLIDGMAFTGTVPFIAPFLHERLGLSYAEAGLVLACFGLGCYGYIRLAPQLVRNLQEAQLVLMGGLIASAGMFLVWLSRAWQAYVAAEILLGLGYFMLHTVLQARATEMLPRARGVAVSSFAFALFTGQALGAVLCACGIAAWGYRMVFGADCFALMALGTALWIYMRPRTGGGWHGVNHKTEQA